MQLSSCIESSPSFSSFLYLIVCIIHFIYINVLCHHVHRIASSMYVTFKVYVICNLNILSICIRLYISHIHTTRTRSYSTHTLILIHILILILILILTHTVHTSSGPKGEKLLVVLVGLPNTGKTLIARKISRYSNSALLCCAVLHYTTLHYTTLYFSSHCSLSFYFFSWHGDYEDI